MIFRGRRLSFVLYRNINHDFIFNRLFKNVFKCVQSTGTDNESSNNLRQSYHTLRHTVLEHYRPYQTLRQTVLKYDRAYNVVHQFTDDCDALLSVESADGFGEWRMPTNPRYYAVVSVDEIQLLRNRHVPCMLPCGDYYVSLYRTIRQLN